MNPNAIVILTKVRIHKWLTSVDPDFRQDDAVVHVVMQ